MTVLAGYTRRPESEVALTSAVAEAKLRGAPLHVLWSLPEPTTSSGERLLEWQRDLEAARQAASELRQRLEGTGVTATVEVSTDAPAAALVGRAQELGAQLLVIGVRRRSSVGKLVLGSVAQDVLLGADCPVLAVKVADPHA